MGFILKLFGGSKLLMAVAVFALLAAGAAAASAKLYLGKRDELAVAAQEITRWSVSVDGLRLELDRQERLSKAAEGARIALAEENETLRNRGAEVVTEIREVWRDREVIAETPVAAECVVTAVPRRAFSLLCEATGTRTGPCAVQPPTS